MNLTEFDIILAHGSVSIELLNKRDDVERLYSLDELMRLKDWFLYVNDFDYLGFLSINLSKETTEIIINDKEEKQLFINDLIYCINEILTN